MAWDKQDAYPTPWADRMPTWQDFQSSQDWPSESRDRPSGKSPCSLASYRRHLGTVPLSGPVQSGHELETQDPVTLADLVDYSIILPARNRQPLIYETCGQFTAEAGAER